MYRPNQLLPDYNEFDCCANHMYFSHRYLCAFVYGYYYIGSNLTCQYVFFGTCNFDVSTKKILVPGKKTSLPVVLLAEMFFLVLPVKLNRLSVCIHTPDATGANAATDTAANTFIRV
ncbi:hypothetical protein SMWOGL2_50940 [Sporomusa malonica]